jgi:hypothetical protein
MLGQLSYLKASISQGQKKRIVKVLIYVFFFSRVVKLGRAFHR